MKRIGGMHQGRMTNRPQPPHPQQRKTFSFSNPPGLFPFVMKGFEFYNPPVNQMVMGHMREDRIKKTVDALYSHNVYRCAKCGVRFQNHASLKEHLDYHFQQSVLATDRRSGPMTRKPFSTYFNWVSDFNIDIINQNHDTMTREEKELENSIPFSTYDCQCFVCGEEFKTEMSKHLFINCKKIKINNTVVKVHVNNCAKIIEEQVAKYKENKAKMNHEEEANTSQSSIKK